jgi:hypothetical protein
VHSFGHRAVRSSLWSALRATALLAVSPLVLVSTLFLAFGISVSNTVLLPSLARKWQQISLLLGYLYSVSVLLFELKIRARRSQNEAQKIEKQKLKRRISGIVLINK